MDRLNILIRDTRRILFVSLLLNSVIIFGVAYFGLSDAHHSTIRVIIGMVLLALALSAVTSKLLAKLLQQPTKALWQAILHVSPNDTKTPAPNPASIKLGRELVTALSRQVYQLASTTNPAIKTVPEMSGSTNEIADSSPLPLIAVSKDLKIVWLNKAAQEYLHADDDTIGKDFYAVIDMSFPNGDTLDSWLTKVREDRVVAMRTWEYIRLRLPNAKEPMLLDLAARYSRDTESGIELILTLFDHTKTYSQDETSLSFIALAAHELRGPITILRGYIDVFQEELTGSLTPELEGFMLKMEVAALQLTSFVNNILMVARVEDDQLELKLQEQNWDSIIKGVLTDLALTAEVQQKTLLYTPNPDLPTVAVDQVSIYEVLSNLLSNAIKYSGPGHKEITIETAVRPDGFIETRITDQGMGIAANVLPHLFEKFYRSHRTGHKIAGTGLGLYLSKMIITAHGGDIWVQSKEGKGSTFGFTLEPYARVKESNSSKTIDEDDGIVRVAHGWIKNHSLYRR